MKIYTRTGDSGETGLFGPRMRVPKDDARVEAYGTVDELNAFIGLARAAWPDAPFDGQLAAIQSDLFDIGALLASPGSAAHASVAIARACPTPGEAEPSQFVAPPCAATSRRSDPPAVGPRRTCPTTAKA